MIPPARIVLSRPVPIAPSRNLVPGEHLLGFDASRFTNHASRLFRAAQHVVDERPINIRATRTDGIEEQLVVGYEIPRIRQVVGLDVVVAGVAEHHQAPGD